MDVTLTNKECHNQFRFQPRQTLLAIGASLRLLFIKTAKNDRLREMQKAQR